MLGFIDAAIKGIDPLISNNPDSINTLPGGNVDRKSPEYQRLSFECSLYRNSKGLYQPAEHILQSMIHAGSKIKFKGRQMHGSVLNGGIQIRPMEIPHPKKDKPVYFSKWAVIDDNRIWKTRAMFPVGWTLKFQIEVLNDALNFDSLKEILESAGIYQGLGDWRPKYGKYVVTEFKKARKAVKE